MPFDPQEFERRLLATKAPSAGGFDPAKFAERMQATQPAYQRLTPPAPPSMLSSIGTMAKEGALPLAGQLGGAALGAASPVPGGMLIGEALGSAGGEALSQATGLKERSVMDEGLNKTDIAISGAAPGVGRGLWNVGKGAVTKGVRLLPGAGAAIQEYGAKQARGALTWLQGRVGDVESLYKVVEGYNPVIKTGSTIKALEDLTKHYASNVPNVMEEQAPVQEVKKLAEGLLAEMKATGQMSFQKLRGAQKLMNESFGQASGTLRHAYGKIKEAMWEDMNAAASTLTNQTSPQAVMALKAANAAFKKKLAYDELQHIVETKAISERTGDQMTGFNRRTVMKALKDNPTITDNLSKAELATLRLKMKDIGMIPALPPPPGQHVGSSRTLMSGALGGLAGFGAHGAEGAGVGAMAGPLVMEGIEKMALTEPGRKAIVKMATAKGPKLAPDVAAALAAWTSGSTP